LPYFKGADHAIRWYTGVSAGVLAISRDTADQRLADFALSSVLPPASLLCQAGVDAELHVYEGMWHSFFSDPELPESARRLRRPWCGSSIGNLGR